MTAAAPRRDGFAARPRLRSALGAVVAGAMVLACSGSPLPGGGGGNVDPPVRAGETPATDVDATAVVDALLRGDYGFVSARFNRRMSSALSVEELADATEGLVGTVGSVESVGGAAAVLHDGGLVYFVPISFERALIHARITYDGDGRIAGLYLLR